MILDYVANMKKGDQVSRKNFQSLFEGYTTRHSTIDGYVWQFRATNVLIRIKPGLYEKNRDIRNDWSLSEYKKITAGNTWKSWFMKID